LDTSPIDYSLGCRLDAAAWADFNRRAIFEDAALRACASPFPPAALMRNVAGVDLDADFAKQGALFWEAFSKLLPSPISAYSPVLDFGCGCGRLARLFKGHPGAVHGCDIDARHVRWMHDNLDFMDTVLVAPTAALPFPDNHFALVFAVSVLTHLDESDQDRVLAELRRVTRPDGILLVTTHGERAVQRARWDDRLFGILDIDVDAFRAAVNTYARGSLAFVPQRGHLTTNDFTYGITFLPEAYVRSHWGAWFAIERIAHGALQNFQDIVVMRPRKERSDASSAR
jgi:SAM-dependent methyltransferase